MKTVMSTDWATDQTACGDEVAIRYEPLKILGGRLAFEPRGVPSFCCLPFQPCAFLRFCLFSCCLLAVSLRLALGTLARTESLEEGQRLSAFGTGLRHLLASMTKRTP